MADRAPSSATHSSGVGVPRAPDRGRHMIGPREERSHDTLQDSRLHRGEQQIDTLLRMRYACNRPDPARNGRIRPVVARSPPLAAWAACSKWSARSRIFPWTSTTWSMRVMKFRPKFLLLYRTLLDALIPDLPVSHAEAVGVARFCSPNLVGFIFGPPSYE